MSDATRNRVDQAEAELQWSERQQAATLVGALVGTAGLIRCRPTRAAAVRAAVLAGLGDNERELLRALALDLSR